jgi:hypothetical protein
LRLAQSGHDEAAVSKFDRPLRADVIEAASSRPAVWKRSEYREFTSKLQKYSSPISEAA